MQTFLLRTGEILTVQTNFGGFVTLETENHESSVSVAEIWKPPSLVADSVVDEESLRKVLKSIEKESMHLDRYLAKERKLTRESCELLRNVLNHLKTPFEITPAIPGLKEKPVKAVLNEEGKLVLMYGKKRVDSKPLEEYEPEVVMSVIWMVLPKLEEAIRDYGQKVRRRIGLFEKVKTELKNIFKVFYTAQEKRGGS